MKIGVIGAGTMGIGIAQVAAQNKNDVFLIDSSEVALEKAKQGLKTTLQKLVEKGKITEDDLQETLEKTSFSHELKVLAQCDLVIEAIIENLSIKHELFREIEKNVSENCIIASNTSSLSIASLGSVIKNSNRVIGIHFFNPAPIMPLVEIIPAVQTSQEVLKKCQSIISDWGKIGFIVNRVARPFYGEALRIYEEGIADFATIDWAMTEFGGFKMGPFTLMDYIGNDVNYAVTESVFEAFYFDPRFKPSFTQKRHKEAGFLGRKTGRGYYDYSIPELPSPTRDKDLGLMIYNRILCLLINEATDAVFMQIGSVEAIDLAMTKGVNYPKGLLKWADEIGLAIILNQLENLFHEYGEDRYRPNALLRRMVREKKKFY